MQSVRPPSAGGQSAIAPVLLFGLPHEGLAADAGPPRTARRRGRSVPSPDRGTAAPVAPLPLPGVRLDLVRQRHPVRDPEAVGQSLLHAAVPHEGVAPKAIAFSRRHAVTPFCDANGLWKSDRRRPHPTGNLGAARSTYLRQLPDAEAPYRSARNGADRRWPCGRGLQECA